MLPVRKRIEPDGRVSIGEMLKAANLRPGDLVEIVGDRNKIVIKPLAQKRPKAWLDRSPANGGTASTSSRTCWLSGRTRMIALEQPSNRCCVVDTNIIIYSMQGLPQVVGFMEAVEHGEFQCLYSAIVVAELFSSLIDRGRQTGSEETARSWRNSRGGLRSGSKGWRATSAQQETIWEEDETT